MNYKKDKPVSSDASAGETAKKPRFFKSVTFQSWLSFLALAFLIVGIMTVFVLLAVGFVYNREKESRALQAGSELILTYPGNPDDEAAMDQYLKQVETSAKVNELSFVTFRLKDDADVEHATSADLVSGIMIDYGSRDESRWKTADETYFAKLATCGNEIFSYATESPDYEGNVVIMGARRYVGGEVVYFYISALILERDLLGDFILKMWVGITLLVLIVSVIYAYYISRKVTGPLVRFHLEVQSSAQTGKPLQVSGNGYTEIDDLATALNESAIEQAKTEEFRRDLLANVSHDLRTPLTMIKAYSEMIRDLSGDNPKKRNEHCKIIINEVDTLNRLVGDLLDLSKMQAGTLKMDMRAYDIGAVVSTVVSRLDMYRTRDGYDITVSVSEGCVVYCDRYRIEQAIYNLICNAINYTGADKKVVVTLSIEGDNVRFSVRDTGKGIKEEEIERIWDKYYRSNESKRGVAGSGIGLSIVQNVLLAHDAKFGVNSKVGEGSEFWFILPLYKEENDCG